MLRIGAGFRISHSVQFVRVTHHFVNGVEGGRLHRQFQGLQHIAVGDSFKSPNTRFLGWNIETVFLIRHSFAPIIGDDDGLHGSKLVSTHVNGAVLDTDFAAEVQSQGVLISEHSRIDARRSFRQPKIGIQGAEVRVNAQHGSGGHEHGVHVVQHRVVKSKHGLYLQPFAIEIC